MANPPRKTNAAKVVRGVKSYTTAREGYGVLKNLRTGGTTRKTQIASLRSQLRSEGFSKAKRQRIVGAAKAVKTYKQKGK